MMIQATPEMAELYKKLDTASTYEEKVKIHEKITELAKEQYKALENCPFCH